MRAVLVRQFFWFPIVFSLLAIGCAGPTSSTRARLQPGHALSRDGVLRYRVPAGWFDATPDSQSAGHAIWLLRNDYRASMMVDEIHLDGNARKVLRKGDLLQLARLILPLAEREKGALVAEPPSLISIGRREMCAYELLTADENDRLRIILFDTGERVYSAALYRSGAGKESAGGDDRLVQEAFVDALRW